MRSKKLIIYGIAVVLLVVMLIIQGSPSKDLCMRQQKEFNQEQYQGVISKLFLDNENHQAMTIEIKNEDSTFVKWLFSINTMRKMYSDIQVGDLIKKNKGDNFIQILNDEGVKNYQVDLACDS